jgi:hypothetical protein
MISTGSHPVREGTTIWGEANAAPSIAIAPKTTPDPPPRTIADRGARDAPARCPPKNAANGGAADRIQSVGESSSEPDGSGRIAPIGDRIASSVHGHSWAAAEPATTKSMHEPDAGTSSNALWAGSAMRCAPKRAAPADPKPRRPST